MPQNCRLEITNKCALAFGVGEFYRLSTPYLESLLSSQWSAKMPPPCSNCFLPLNPYAGRSVLLSEGSKWAEIFCEILRKEKHATLPQKLTSSGISLCFHLIKVQ